MSGDGRYKFSDPKTGTVYVWDRAPNPDGEQPFGKTLPITHSQSTGGKSIWQQGDPGPLVRQLKGRILKHDQFVQFWTWYALSQKQTIYFTDAFGDEYEVQITSFLPQIVGVVRNTRDQANAGPRVWDYTMDLTVYNALAGDLQALNDDLT